LTPKIYFNQKNINQKPLMGCDLDGRVIILATKRKAKLTPKEEHWEKVRSIYVYGQKDLETGEQVYPSQGALAKQFEIPPSTIGSRAKRENWKAARDAAKDQILDETRQKIADTMIKNLVELNEQDLLIYEGQIENYVAKMIAGEIDVTTSEVQRALVNRRKVYHEILGDDKPENIPVKGNDHEVNVQVGVAVKVDTLDLGHLNIAEQEVLLNAVSRARYKHGGDQEGEFMDASPASIVPPLAP
jgi:hypothetical protein